MNDAEQHYYYEVKTISHTSITEFNIYCIKYFIKSIFC